MSTPTATIIAWEIGTPRELLLPLPGVLDTTDAECTAFTWRHEVTWEPQSILLSGFAPGGTLRTLLDGVVVTAKPSVVDAGQVLRVEFRSPEQAEEFDASCDCDDLLTILAAYVVAKISQLKDEVHDHVCPGCKQTLECECRRPHKAGDYTVCNQCGTIARHSDDGGDPVEAPLSVLPPDHVEQLLRVQRQVRSRMPS